jgi:hypothetical protein
MADTTANLAAVITACLVFPIFRSQNRLSFKSSSKIKLAQLSPCPAACKRRIAWTKDVRKTGSLGEKLLQFN